MQMNDATTSLTADQFVRSAKRHPWLLMYADLCRTAADVALCETQTNFEKNQAHFAELYWASRPRIQGDGIGAALDNFYAILMEGAPSTPALKGAAILLLQVCQATAQVEPGLARYVGWFQAILSRLNPTVQ